MAVGERDRALLRGDWRPGYPLRVRVALFVPCYVDQLAPEAAMATLRVLEHVGCSVHYDPRQTCCGQAFLNSGAAREGADLARRHLARFAGFDAVVAPSASCVATVRLRFPELGVGRDEASAGQREHTYELGEFLVRVLDRTDLGARFPHRVAIQQGCHGLRDLGLATPSERDPGRKAEPGTTERLLRAVEGLELVTPERPDECCGFGGAFSVKLPELSVRIGRDRLERMAACGAEVVTGTDVSCLLHLESIRRRRGTGPRAVSLPEILASGLAP